MRIKLPDSFSFKTTIRALSEGMLLCILSMVFVLALYALFPPIVVISGDPNYRPDPAKVYDLDTLIKEGEAVRKKVKSMPVPEGAMRQYISDTIRPYAFGGSVVYAIGLFVRRKKPFAYLALMAAPGIASLVLLFIRLSQ